MSLATLTLAPNQTTGTKAPYPNIRLPTTRCPLAFCRQRSQTACRLFPEQARPAESLHSSPAYIHPSPKRDPGAKHAPRHALSSPQRSALAPALVLPSLSLVAIYITSSCCCTFVPPVSRSTVSVFPHGLGTSPPSSTSLQDPRHLEPFTWFGHLISPSPAHPKERHSTPAPHHSLQHAS